MSPENPEPAPPLLPEDLALESSLHAVRPFPAASGFLDRLLIHLECAAAEQTDASSPDSPPMPLDASLLAFESELRALRPLDVDFPTGQRVLNALHYEMTALAPSPLTVLSGTAQQSQPPQRHNRWAAAKPWAAAAALVAAGWFALPHVPYHGSNFASHADPGLIPILTPASQKGSVSVVFPATPLNQVFASPGGQPFSTGHEAAPMLRSVSFSKPVPLLGLLGVQPCELTADEHQSLGIEHGALIGQVFDNGPAHAYGLKAGDIIMRINGAPVFSGADLPVMVRNSSPGARAILDVLRNGRIIKLSVRFGAAPSA